MKTNFRQLYLGLQLAITGRFAQRMHFNSWNFGHPSGSAGCFGAIFWATAHAADAIAHEMKNAVHGIRALGEARIAGPQTRSVNRLIIPASALAATRGKIENSTPRPQAICPAPVT